LCLVKSKIKILHVCENIKGGIATYLNEQDVHQSFVGKYVHMYCVPRDQCDQLSCIDKNRLLTFHYKGRKVLSLFAYAMDVYCVIKHEMPDIIHVHSTFAGVVVRLLKAARLIRTKLVYTTHGGVYIMTVNEYKKKLYALVERLLYPFTDVLICISQYELNKAMQYGIPVSRTCVVYNGISPEIKTAGCENIIKFKKNVVNSLFVGRWDYAKGVDILLQVFGGLDPKQYHLYVIGGNVLGDQVIGEVPDNVTVLGWIDRSILDCYYSQADVVVVPSRWDGFGLVVIEAMKNSKAVIVSDGGALPELVDNGTYGYMFSLSNVGSLRDHLLAYDQADYIEMGRRGYTHYKNNYTSERMSLELTLIYDQLLG